ncbi:MAG: MerR family transcriptional regulator [Solirubrobacteraceae bacterium]|nr:MerR family transcriptional regulator [Solirubrobacteraceae bacterium]
MSTPANDMTVEQLASATGQSVRNIRAHQSRGLLPPPEVRGRTGYYGAPHVERLRLIRELQADGFNLTAIGHLLDSGRFGEEAAGLRQLLLQGFESESPEILDAEEVFERFGGEATASRIQRAVKLGLLTPVGDGRFEIASPRLLRAGVTLNELGVGTDLALDLIADLQRHAQAAARAFVKLFLEGVWKPFEAAGMPDEQWADVRNALVRLRPLASEAYLAVFEPIMSQSAEDAFGRELERLRRSSKPSSSSGRRHRGGRRHRSSRD